MNVLFNRNTATVHGSIEQPPVDVVKATPSLWQADLDTAIMYGGELTRQALGAMNIRGDKKHVVVDTKVHMLMAGQCPAIPGWHTDGAPRSTRDNDNTSVYSPIGKGAPDLIVQQRLDDEGLAPRFHLLVTGEGCLTEFIWAPLTLDVPYVPTHDLYKIITRSVAVMRGERPHNQCGFAPSCHVVEWDWWNLHQGVLATKSEWRFLIRVTESDQHEPMPRSRLSEIIRTQQMVYTPLEFGW